MSAHSEASACVYIIAHSLTVWLLSGSGMAEDGSFIGQYGKKKGETSSNAFATLV